LFQDFFSGSKDERVENFLYSLLHHTFGLPSSYALDAGQSNGTGKKRSYLTTRWANSYIQAFSITGPNLIPQFLMLDDSYSVYNRIDRDIGVPQGRRFAYNFSKIQEGTLSAQLVYEGSPELQASDECRVLLNLIYQSGVQRWNNIPLVYAEPGPIYAATGLPDRIYLQLPTATEASVAYRDCIMRNIANHYQIQRFESIEYRVQQDRETSSMNFIASVKQKEPDFPYAYYHSIGLIDNEGMVTGSSFLGPVRFPADSDAGREHLLKAGQEQAPVTQESASPSNPPTQDQTFEDVFNTFFNNGQKPQ
jgi:hypothetical protein